MDNGRLPDLPSHPEIRVLCDARTIPLMPRTEIEFHSLGIDSAIDLQELDTCTNTMGAPWVSILTNLLSDKQCTNTSPHISGGIRRDGLRSCMCASREA